MDLYPDRFQVTQDRLLNLVANLLFDIDDEEEGFEKKLQKIIDAINLLPRLADGIHVNIKFRSIDDFERTPELAIFELLKIPLYHGWIFDPQDYETATAIGCKSYNDLMTALVTLAQTQTVKGQGCGECSVDFSAALGTPSQRCSKTEHDIKEERALLQALRLSERDNLGLDTRRDSDVYLMSEDDSLVDSMDTASTHGSGNICPKSRCDDQFSSKGSGDDTDFAVGEKTSEACVHDHLYSKELKDEMVCDVETNNSGNTTALHATSSDMIFVEKTDLESTKNDSRSENSLKSEALTFVNPDVTGRSQDDDQFSSKELEDAGNKINLGEESRSSMTKSGSLENGHLSSMELGDKTVSGVETENSSNMTDVHVTFEKTNGSFECQLKSEAVTFDNPDVTFNSPVYEGELTRGQISQEGKDTNILTPEEGQVIKNFLNNNANQLTFLGLFLLQEGLNEGQLCVFFRNNHFYTMLKNENSLYNLVTDQGYMNQRDLVWENLNQVNGDSVFMTSDFKVFEFDSGNWDQQDAVSITADYIYSNNSLSKEGMEIDPDLTMAMELQEQELGEDIDLEVLIKRQSQVFFNTRSESSPKKGKCTYQVLLSV